MKKNQETATTEEKIIQATLEVIEEKTISETRMRTIADRAGVYQSNLHYYYKSKKELLLAVQKRVADRCVALRTEERKGALPTLEGELDVFIQQKLTFITKEPKYDYAEIDFWLQSRQDKDFQAEFKRSYHVWRQELQQLLEKYAPFMEESQRGLLASVIISLLEGATIQYLIDADAFSPEVYFSYCKNLVLQAVRNQIPKAEKSTFVLNP